MDKVEESKHRESFNFEKVKFWVSVIKWLIGGVAIVITTLIINSGFKERVTGIQEMEAFNKYVDVILKADNIEERWRLSQFFSTVTPTERLRHRWENYRSLIQPDYDTFKKLKQKEFELSQDVQKKKSPSTIKKLNEVKRELEQFQTKLATTPVNLQNNNQEDYKATDKLTTTNLDTKIKTFKETLKRESISDPRYKIADYFKKMNDVYYSVVGELTKELGDPYESIQTGINYNYTESTYSNQYGIISKFDKSKKIWPMLRAKFTSNSVIVNLEENGKTDRFTTPINNIQWNKIKQFIRAYFVNHLNKLK